MKHRIHSRILDKLLYGTPYRAMMWLTCVFIIVGNVVNILRIMGVL